MHRASRNLHLLVSAVRKFLTCNGRPKHVIGTSGFQGETAEIRSCAKEHSH